MFNNIVLNVVYITFPLLLYFFLIVYKNMKNMKKSNLFLGISLFSSMYLSLKYGNVLHDERLLIFCNIPIVIAYIKKKKILALVLSLVLIVYVYMVIKSDIIYFLLIKYIIYFIVAMIYKKKNNLLFVLALVQGFMLSFEYVFKRSIYANVYEMLYIILVVFLFYLITFGILYVFEIADKISGVYLNYKELERNKQIKNSLFKLTHEIKNPIAVCLGYLEMFDFNDALKSKRYVEIMKGEIDRTLNILNDFLELSKIKVEQDILDINMLIYDIVDVLKLIFDKKDILFANNINEDDEVYIMGDYNRLKQVFINLLKNSYEAIETKGNIIINGFVLKNYYVIEIIDDGIGMDKETLNNIKHAFYTTKRNGSGVGVTLSNEIISAHQGILSYKSKENEGTKTIIKLPLLKLKED